ncbi:MAG: hypothetical protein RIS75_1270 [Actinomycetota bacterium]
MATKDALGKLGERIASHHLKTLGFQILAHNWRATAGEVDVVAVEGDCLVMCEVKTRRSLSHGHPSEAVNAVRVSHLSAAVEQWLAGDSQIHRGRVDVVSIVVGPPLAIEHMRNVAA